MAKISECFKKLKIPRGMQNYIMDNYLSKGSDEKRALDLFFMDIDSGINDIRDKLKQQGFDVEVRTSDSG